MIAQTWQRLAAWEIRGPWRPGTHNIVLLIVQVVVLWTAAQRGMDYYKTPSLAERVGPQARAAFVGIEAQVSPTILGMAFLLPAGVAFTALAFGWAKPLSLGHLFVGASYLVLGSTFLRNSPVDSWVTSGLGAGLLLVATALLVVEHDRIPDIVALVLGVGCLILGGLIAADGLGSGYRTGNGLIGAAVIHFVIGFGTQVLSRRDERLRREEAEDRALHGEI